MLGGIDPIIIFNFSKVVPDLGAALESIPFAAKVLDKIALPSIPVYLSEKITGLYIDSEDKSIEIDTATETLPDGTTPSANQKGLASTVRINLVANRNSIGMTLISALADLIFQKVTSKEYSISYFHNGVAVFDGLLNSFNVTQGTSNTLYNISIELSKSTAKPANPTKADPNIVELPKTTGTIPLTVGVP